MAEFTEVIEQKKRMCNQFDSCNDCPFVKWSINVLHTGCNVLLVHHPEEAEEIIMKWAEENPIKTNADKFKEVFGILPAVDSCAFCNSMYCKISDDGACNSTCEMYDFWKNEYKEPDKEIENE